MLITHPTDWLDRESNGAGREISASAWPARYAEDGTQAA